MADDTIWLDSSGGMAKHVVNGDWSTIIDHDLAEAIAAIELLPGPKGDKGDTGEQGVPGTEGQQGIQGEQGLTGSQGIPGNDGAPGAQGEQGVQGIQGIPGNDGAPGAKGDTGATGAKGDKGDTGEQGLQGYQGIPGDTGAKGDKGDTGVQGIQGIQGVPGADGAQGLTGFPQILITLWQDAALTAWTNMPAAVTEFRSVLNTRTKIDLTSATQSRVIARVGITPYANAKIKVQYSADESTWYDLCSVTMPATANKTNVGVWTAVPAGAKADTFLRVVGIDGDGIADPTFGLISLGVK